MAANGSASGKGDRSTSGRPPYDRALYVEEIFLATSTSRSVSLPPTSCRVSSNVMCTSEWFGGAGRGSRQPRRPPDWEEDGPSGRPSPVRMRRYFVSQVAATIVSSVTWNIGAIATLPAFGVVPSGRFEPPVWPGAMARPIIVPVTRT